MTRNPSNESYHLRRFCTPKDLAWSTMTRYLRWYPFIGVYVSHGRMSRLACRISACYQRLYRPSRQHRAADCCVRLPWGCEKDVWPASIGRLTGLWQLWVLCLAACRVGRVSRAIPGNRDTSEVRIHEKHVLQSTQASLPHHPVHICFRAQKLVDCAIATPLDRRRCRACPAGIAFHPPKSGASQFHCKDDTAWD